MHIAIAGNIGSGKTTLTKLLAHRYGWIPRFEPVDNNPYLADFYADMPRWSFNLQIYFLNKRFKEVVEISKSEDTIIQDRTIFEDARIFAPNLHDQGMMSDRDFANYTDLFDLMMSLVKLPDLMIYIRSSIPTLVAQIQKRGREYEQTMRLDYLQGLEKRYEDWIATYKGPLIIVDGDNCKFGDRPGSRESLAAAIQAGADSIYFGIEKLNMRAHSASTFTIDDLREIAATCDEHGIKSYLTVNTIIYGEDIPLMHEIIDAAKEAGISAVIASDVAVMTYCNKVGQEVHLSTQLNISNIEALKFYAQFADVVVLARELNMDQVAEIFRQVEEQHICGPSGNQIRIEMFCHGALCMAISGKCYMSLHAANRSANRGECIQVCRRSYTATDNETGYQLDIDNKYIMSPKDLKTVRFIDRMMKSGVRVFKIEGRARGPEYVYTVVTTYREAIKAVLDGTFTEERKDEWDARLATVFNRGFWDGYYQGQLMGEWNKHYGSNATERKVYIGKGVKYFSKLGVAEFTVEANTFKVGDKMLITGPTTGVMYVTADEIHGDNGPVEVAEKGTRVSIAVTDKVRPSDKLFKLEQVEQK